MKYSRFLALSVLFSILLFSACDNSTNTSGEEQNDPSSLTRSSDQDIKNRIKMFSGNQSVNKFKPNTSSQLKGAQKQLAETIAIRPKFNLVPPAVRNSEGNDGSVTSQLFVNPSTNKVYVGYMEAGEGTWGGIDILDGTPGCYEGPEFSCEGAYYYTGQMDVTSIAATDEYIFIGGAFGPAGMDWFGMDSPAFVVRYYAPVFNIGTTTFSEMASYSVTDIAIVDNKIYVVSGDNGGRLKTQPADADFRQRNVLGDVAIPVADGSNKSDARSIAHSSNTLFILNGDGKVYTQPLSDPTAELALLGDAGEGIRPLTNATMSYLNNRLYVPLNDGGFAVMNAESGSLITTMVDGAYYSSIAAESINGRELIFAAGNYDDHARVNVYEWESESLALLGEVDFDASQANLVQVLDNQLLVSSDSLGMQTLEINF